MSEEADQGILSRKSFLIVDGDKSALDRLERYLLMEAAHKVYTATAPLQALRILQDRRTPVDCVVCPNKQGRISGLEFVENLRAGRWGASLRDVVFVLTMSMKDEAVLRRADSAGVNAYIFGDLDRTTVIDVLKKAVAGEETESPLKRYRIAHIRLGGADVILVPMGGDFMQLSDNARSQVLERLNAAAVDSRLGGQVIPVWDMPSGGMGYIAPSALHPALSAVNIDFVYANANRTILLSEPLPFTAEAKPKQAVKSMGGSSPADAGCGGQAARSADFGGGVSAANDGPTGRPELHAARSTDEDQIVEDSADTGHGSGRCMTHVDIGKVILAYRQLGSQKFLKAFLREQHVVERGAGNNFVPVMHEYFFGLDKLRKALFPDVDLRKSGKFMGELTLALDQAMMRSISSVPNLSSQFSINLNIQSVFTPTFDSFIQNVPTENLTVEFRQPNIVEYFDEYVTARQLLESKGVKIIVDRIFPDTFGLVNLDFIGAEAAKLNWTGVTKWQDLRVPSVERMLERGISLVVTRVDEEVAVELAEKLGVRRFQGFYFDNILAKRAA